MLVIDTNCTDCILSVRNQIPCQAIISDLGKRKIKVISVRTSIVCAEHAFYLLNRHTAKRRFKVFNFQKLLQLLRLFNHFFLFLIPFSVYYPARRSHLITLDYKNNYLPSPHFLDNLRFACGEHAN